MNWWVEGFESYCKCSYREGLALGAVVDAHLSCKSRSSWLRSRKFSVCAHQDSYSFSLVEKIVLHTLLFFKQLNFIIFLEILVEWSVSLHFLSLFSCLFCPGDCINSLKAIRSKWEKLERKRGVTRASTKMMPRLVESAIRQSSLMDVAIFAPIVAPSSVHAVEVVCPCDRTMWVSCEHTSCSRAEQSHHNFKHVNTYMIWD